jgi:ParB-like chromosome segregation protein Spo0J
MLFSRIPIKYIDFTDNTFSLKPDNYSQDPPENLKGSIQRAGILHPPIVKEHTPSSFQIITGRNRLLSAIKNGQTSCNCYKTHPDISDDEALDISLEDTILSHPLSDIEEAQYLRKAIRSLSIEEAAVRYSLITGGRISSFQTRQKLKLLALEDPIQTAVHEKLLEGKVALEMCKMAFVDRMTLFEIITVLQLSVSNQKKLTVSCLELAGRMQTSLRDILSGEDVKQILTHHESNLPQKASQIMGLIYRKRFPRLTEEENTFHKFISGLQLPDNISLTHSPSFEKDTVHMDITFSNREECMRVWQNIANHCKSTSEE